MKLICCLFLIMTTVANAAHYSSQWAVHIEGGPQVANSIAAKHGFVNLGEIFPDMYHFEHRSISKRSADPSIEHHENLLKESEVKWAKQQKVKSRKKRDLLPLPRSRSHYRVSLNDPRWQQMWYLNRGEGLDMNVQPAWQEGVIGRGVVVTILDDGLEKDHPDLFRNYDPQASYDVNNHDEDPMPRYDLIDSNRHGTRCAGEVAAAANNTLCAVGVAYGASVGGVRMLDGDVTDAVEARSLSLNPQHIDIYSASWGPDDDGKTVDGPGELATRAFMEGVNKGRSGKGSIFVWASGNGGRDHDNCNCDGYTNSIWTLSISSATENGHVPWYSEACSSTLATTYSSGASGEKQVVTTDLHHQCTSSHTGTSASAPLAAGICALALEANRELTWRDMQHIVVRTARPANLKSVDWKVNGVGRNVSHSFGYGLMDASAMVRLARKWKTVPEQRQCEVSAPHVDKPIPAKSHVTLELHVKECAGVNYLEHVQAKISLASSRRGDLQIHLTSPTGTRSTLLARRPHDVSRSGFQDWPFMSVHTWGEKPFGKWQLEIHNEGRFLGRATLQKWAIIFYGTTITPDGNDGPSPPIPPFRGSPGSSSLPSRPSRPIPGPKSPPFVMSVSPQHKTKTLSSGRQKNNQKLTIKQTPPRAPPTVPSRLSVIETRQHIVPTANRPRLKNSTISTIATRLTTKKPKVLPTSRIPYNLSNITNSTQTTSSSINGSIANVSIVFPTTISKTTTTLKTTSTTTTTSTSTTTPGSDLTILLEPPSHTPPKVPEIFQHYPKFQQLIPLYPLTKLDGLGGGNKGRVDSSSFRPSANLVPNKLEFVQEETRHQTAGAGSLSQWKLVFYGTETAPDGDLFDSEDDSRKVSVNIGTNSLGARPGMPDIRDNEEDPQQNLVLPVPGGGQWKSVPDHSRNDIPRTTTEDDKASSSASTCLALSKKGQQCIECIDGLYLYGGRCVSKCPDNYFPGKNEKSQLECMWCHYTCKTCLGPNDYQCATCYGDASLQQMSKTESYCYPKSLLPAIETEKWFYWMFVAFSVNGILLVLIICYFVVFKIMKKSSTHQYSKINRAEDAVHFTENLDCVKNVVYELSDSDSN